MHMLKRLSIILAAVVAVLALIAMARHAAAFNLDLVGQRNFDLPSQFLDEAGPDLNGDPAFTWVPPIPLQGAVLDTSPGVIYHDGPVTILGQMDPAGWQFPSVTNWRVNPGVEAYGVGVYLAEEQTDVIIVAYGIREDSSGLLDQLGIDWFESEGLLAVRHCNAGQRFCGMQLNHEITRFEVRSASPLTIIRGLAIGFTDLHRTTYRCGFPIYKYGGGVFYWQAGGGTRFASTDNYGCASLVLDRPGEQIGFFGWGAGLF